MKGKLLITGCCLAVLLFFISPVQAAADPVVDRLDIGNGSINIVAEGKVVQNGQTYSFSMDRGLTLTGSSEVYGVMIQYGVGSDKIVPITLENLSINTSKADLCAFSVLEAASTAITLAPGTNNTLISADYFAGLQVQNQGGQIGRVIIDGTGSLTAVGGKGSTGIGGAHNVAHWYGTGGNIIIKDGTITATGGSEGAGIGGGYKGDGGNITISGGTITATGGDLAAGIGGGHYGLKGNLNITIDTVTAIPGNGSDAIGNGADYLQKTEGETVIDLNMGSSTSDPNPTAPLNSTPSPEPQTGAVQETPKTPPTLSAPVIVGLSLLVLVAIGVGVYYYRKKRNAEDSDER